MEHVPCSDKKRNSLKPARWLLSLVFCACFFIPASGIAQVSSRAAPEDHLKDLPRDRAAHAGPIKGAVSNDMAVAVNANNYPARLCEGPDGKVYVSDPRVRSVFIYDADLNLVGEIRNVGRALGIAVGDNGNIYVGNNSSDSVDVYDDQGVKINTIDAGGIKMPNDMALDSAGNLYVADSLDHLVKVYNSSSGARVGDVGWPHDDNETAADGELYFPSAVAVGTSKVYVADQGHGRIQVFNLAGGFLRAYGSAVGGWVPLGDWGWEGHFVRLQSLAMDREGRLHAVDCGLQRVQIFDPETGDLKGFYGTFGSGDNQLNLPLDIFITEDRQVMVANTENKKVNAYSRAAIYVEPDAGVAAERCGEKEPCFWSIQDAMKFAAQGTKIHIYGGEFDEVLTLDIPVDISLSGGWNQDYTGKTLPFSKAGRLEIRQGSINVENLVLK
ncbi:MAG: hypothetical protein GY864_01660 [Desulfobacterales bacterium]|nr:hypothetical protein [Desulfobacterales bacterium]